MTNLGDLIGRTVLEQTVTTDVRRTPDREHYTGTVDGKPFRYKVAMRGKAIAERDRALRTLAAWQAILDADLPTRRH